MELGQIVSNHTVESYDCPDFIQAGLRFLSGAIEVGEWNRTQKTFDSPMDNTGNRYRCGTFDARAYCWDETSDDADLPNFHYKGPRHEPLEIYWYKYIGRGMSMSRDVDANEFFEIIEECVDNVKSR